MHKEHHGFLFGISAAVAITITALLIKWAAHIPNETTVFVRFFLSLLCIAPFAWKHKVKLSQAQFRSHFIRGAAGLGAIYCLFYSVKTLPIVVAVTLSNTTPLMIPIVVFFWLKMVLPKERIWAVLIGFLGVCAILRPALNVETVPLFIALLGSALTAIAQVGIRVLSKTEPTTVIMTYYFLISTILSFFPMIYAWEPLTHSADWLYLVAIALSSLCFQFCLTKSLTHAPASKVSSLNYLSVVFSGILGWTLFGEVPDTWTVVGTLLVIGGGLLALFSKGEVRKRH